ncbi:MAG TPA: serine/threonine-protein kinase [Woeseiaceae bacterium]|nr:serine/threonine-protein kinase [Woeseiaceae bacterium]
MDVANGPRAVNIKVMIIDGQADFRRLLMHHVTTCWPDAVISDYDPTAAGHLPEEFSGAGNDIVLLGDNQGNRSGIKTLKSYARKPEFPPIVYFCSNAEKKREAIAAGAQAVFLRTRIKHDELVVRIGHILRARRRLASTQSLFVGDGRTGIHPLVKGYKFLKKLAASDHSAVYLAEKVSTGGKMVLKVLRQVPDLSDGIGAFDRFLQEYEMIADLVHPNIVKIHDLGVSDDHAHIAMEYLSGGDLKQRIKNGILETDAVRYAREIASALAQVHSVGILHRDLKPGNVMLREDGSIALIDFGLAKRMRLEQEMTGSGEIFGTPYYMSPEQGHADDADARSDIYSLGVIFYEMLTGEKPYKASNAMGIIYKHSHAPIPILSPRLEKYQMLLDRLLAKMPDDRLQSAEEVVAWFNRF